MANHLPWRPSLLNPLYTITQILHRLFKYLVRASTSYSSHTRHPALLYLCSPRLLSYANPRCGFIYIYNIYLPPVCSWTPSAPFYSPSARPLAVSLGGWSKLLRVRFPCFFSVIMIRVWYVPIQALCPRAWSERSRRKGTPLHFNPRSRIFTHSGYARHTAFQNSSRRMPRHPRRRPRTNGPRTISPTCLRSLRSIVLSSRLYRTAIGGDHFSGSLWQAGCTTPRLVLLTPRASAREVR
ncbi:hypothetical protein C8F04DRAFT_157797 [Mycena alexandri]|uniref:Uncharacterized protein n=1 Tax=Mycena alexandri TaxID=1745969 RepID=A0AAD6XB05_9AGAR|nr:hypothetical protein C8F04DRAFT_157797 [Mycena alexandri]